MRVRERRRDMTRFLPPLHEGHAPITLHQAFHEALDVYVDWHDGFPEPAVAFEGEAIPISAVFGRMTGCTDLASVRALDALKWLTGQAFEDVLSDQPTYAEVTCIMWTLCTVRSEAAAA